MSNLLKNKHFKGIYWFYLLYQIFVFLFSLDEMKRRRDFYAAHPSADGKLFGMEKIFYLEGKLTQ